jgi:hypothetical protein
MQLKKSKGRKPKSLNCKNYCVLSKANSPQTLTCLRLNIPYQSNPHIRRVTCYLPNPLLTPFSAHNPYESGPSNQCTRTIRTRSWDPKSLHGHSLTELYRFLGSQVSRIPGNFL